MIEITHIMTGSSWVRRYDVFCVLDSDTLFFGTNLQRVFHIRNITPDDSFVMGNINFLHKFLSTRVLFPDGGTGACMTRRAMQDMHPVLHRALLVTKSPTHRKRSGGKGCPVFS